MINVNVKPVFTRRKLSQTLSAKENKPPIVNTQCVVYSLQCDLCDANYVGFTTALVNIVILPTDDNLKRSMETKDQRSVTIMIVIIIIMNMMMMMMMMIVCLQALVCFHNMFIFITAKHQSLVRWSYFHLGPL